MLHFQIKWLRSCFWFTVIGISIQLVGCGDTTDSQGSVQNGVGSDDAFQEGGETGDEVEVVLSPAARALLAETSTVTIKDAFYELPEWANDLPFDLESNFEISADENREQLYYEAMQVIAGLENWRRFPHLLNANEKVRGNCIEFLRQKRSRFSAFYIARLEENEYDNFVLKPKHFAAANDLLKPYVASLEKLEQAQKLPKCFRHASWTPSSNDGLLFPGGNAIQLLSTKCQAELDSDEAVACVEIGLRLQRDLALLTPAISRLMVARLERDCLTDMALPILNQDKLTKKQLDRLISVLKEHIEETHGTDAFLEATKREVLDLRHVLHLLATKKFVTQQRIEDLGLESDVLPAQLLMREIVDYGFYEINDDEIVREIDKLAKGSPSISAAWSKVKSDTSDGGIGQVGARMMMGMFIHLDLTSLKQSDLKHDVAILDARYREVEKACKLPFPKCSNELKKLEQAWTTDGSWQNTKILRWFLPMGRMASQKRSGHLYKNAYLCLAAIRHWQLEHDGLNPSSLAEALAGIGVDQVPMDVYTVEALKMFVDENSVGVYSTGPDADDDRAKVEYDRWEPDARDGDIIFRMVQHKTNGK